MECKVHAPNVSRSFNKIGIYPEWNVKPIQQVTECESL